MSMVDEPFVENPEAGVFAYDHVPSEPDAGYDEWPSDPFGAETVRWILRDLRPKVEYGKDVSGWTTFGSLQEWAAYYRTAKDRAVQISDGQIVWALRNLVAQGELVRIIDQVPINQVDHSDRGKRVEVFCRPQDEAEIRRRFALPPRTPLSAKRPRATLALSDTRAAVWAMTDGHCWYCGIKTNPFDDFCIDHVRPIALGGSDDIENLVPCCTRCNRDKGKLTIEEFRSMRANWVAVKPEGYSFYFERMGYRP